MKIDKDFLREIFDYTDESFVDGSYSFSGALLWKERDGFSPKIIGRIRKFGAPLAGSWGMRHSSPYQRVNISGSLFYAHRLIWIFHYGELPEGYDVDHIDVDTLNNKISNLRSAEKIWNARNRKSKSESSSKYAGVSVSRNGKAWRARYTKDRVEYYVGQFPTEELAAKARDLAVIEAFGQYAFINIKHGDLP